MGELAWPKHRVLAFEVKVLIRLVLVWNSCCFNKLQSASIQRIELIVLATVCGGHRAQNGFRLPPGRLLLLSSRERFDPTRILEIDVIDVSGDAEPAAKRRKTDVDGK